MMRKRTPWPCHRWHGHGLNARTISITPMTAMMIHTRA